MVDVTIKRDDDGEQEVVIRLESGMTVIARQSTVVIDDVEEMNEVSYDDILYLKKDDENMKSTESLIVAMIEYGESGNWDDSEIIDKLVDCGVIKEDFIRCGYEDFIDEYFEE